MDEYDIINIASEMLYISFLLSLPLLLTALVVGVLISLVQTVTGVQEMTLTFVPKIAAVIAVMVYFLPWMKHLLAEYTEDIFRLMAGA